MKVTLLFQALLFLSLATFAGHSSAPGRRAPQGTRFLSPQANQEVELRCPFVEIQLGREFEAGAELELRLDGKLLPLHGWTRDAQNLTGNLRNLSNGPHELRITRKGALGIEICHQFSAEIPGL